MIGISSAADGVSGGACALMFAAILTVVHSWSATLLLCAADVLTIENSRSGDAMVSALAAVGYGRDLGPGVYDVHSPQVSNDRRPQVFFLDIANHHMHVPAPNMLQQR